ncbi:deoxyribodipyrimidine photo-lyase isoform X2 [Vespa velutina]|uniref:deoxyribodipyrimidine photo-lyase isoform X2 n=1 Tax=Vespa velutina TaxID=202808 RepID=UPI001FB2C675|nr:deoxyribodipyrimidine photo-lyase isoform X2 [Vespa velutina]
MFQGSSKLVTMAEKTLKKNFDTLDLLTKIKNDRKNIANSVTTFQFNTKRVKQLTNLNDIKKDCKGILYWMFRDARVQDNWAFLFAQKTAIKNKVPLHVCFCILPKFLNATMRHYKFLLIGLREIEKECIDLNINFHLLNGEPNLIIPDFVKNYKIGAVITDFLPLRLPLFWIDEVKKKLPNEVSIYQVDAHNIVPCWIASDKLEYSARTIRPKIHSKLKEYLTGFPPVIKHKYSSTESFEKNKWDNALKNVEADTSVEEITCVKSGYLGGILELEDFLKNRLKVYHSKRNDPISNVVSNLSPWFHFGMISVQRCVLEVMEYKRTMEKSMECFIEEAVVRRELSDNFCYYNENYDSIKGAYNWAIETLNVHRHDKRLHTYNLNELENSLTYDDLWNACQNQLIHKGKMHGFLRMYWAKKILEWSPTPENALEWSLYLNDKYSLDGNDPNGYVGCMWSICGIHDRGFKEREIFGKIRYMNYEGCRRKFDVKAFVSKWSEQNPNKKQKLSK